MTQVAHVNDFDYVVSDQPKPDHLAGYEQMRWLYRS